MWAFDLTAKSETSTDKEKGTYTFHLMNNRRCVLCGKSK